MGIRLADSLRRPHRWLPGGALTGRINCTALRAVVFEAHLPAGSAASEIRSQRRMLSAPAVATKGSYEPLEPPPYNHGTESDEHE